MGFANTVVSAKSNHNKCKAAVRNLTAHIEPTPFHCTRGSLPPQKRVSPKASSPKNGFPHKGVPLIKGDSSQQSGTRSALMVIPSFLKCYPTHGSSGYYPPLITGDYKEHPGTISSVQATSTSKSGYPASATRPQAREPIPHVDPEPPLRDPQQASPSLGPSISTGHRKPRMQEPIFRFF